MKEMLQKLCPRDNRARASALRSALAARGAAYECWEEMAIVLPAAADDKVVLCAHFDAVPGSFGYNDNGMSLVTVLSLLERLPACAEVVFTNGEECGFLGAEHYLNRQRGRLLGCVNLDVCGFGNTIYCDPMDSGIELAGCKCGRMPLNDGYVFAEHGIPTLTLSAGPAALTFAAGLGMIRRTIHNGPLDNDLNILNFELPAKVGETALRAIGEFSNVLYSMDAG